MSQRDDLMARAKKHARLAFIYADDGAFATASIYLRQTADIFEAEYRRRDAIMNPKPKSRRIHGKTIS